MKNMRVVTAETIKSLASTPSTVAQIAARSPAVAVGVVLGLAIRFFVPALIAFLVTKSKVIAAVCGVIGYVIWEAVGVYQSVDPSMPTSTKASGQAAYLGMKGK